MKMLFLSRSELKSIYEICDSMIRCEQDCIEDFDDPKFFKRQVKNWQSIKRKIEIVRRVKNK